jgi:hypothetical protein
MTRRRRAGEVAATDGGLFYRSLIYLPGTN